VAEARGDCLAFLDHDDVWSPLKLERQMAPLEANPELGYTRCRLRVFLEADTPRPAWLEDDFFTQGFVAWCDSSIVVRREAFERVGPFDPEITLGEDADWALRAMDAGVTWELVDEALTRYRVHAHNATHAMRARAVLGLLRKSVVRRRASRADQSAA
jgi:GT2 family glycosyltransferase